MKRPDLEIERWRFRQCAGDIVTAYRRLPTSEARRKLLATEPEAGTNTVLVSHGFNITAAAEISIGEGEAAIFAPESDGAFRLVARVGPKEWSALADAAGAGG
jgi:hypothetical protein